MLPPPPPPCVLAPPSAAEPSLQARHAGKKGVEMYPSSPTPLLEVRTRLSGFQSPNAQ